MEEENLWEWEGKSEENENSPDAKHRLLTMRKSAFAHSGCLSTICQSQLTVPCAQIYFPAHPNSSLD